MELRILSIFILVLVGNVLGLVIEDQPMVSDNLYEKEGTELELECITCTGAVGDISVSLISVQPSSDPCSTCFQVYQNLNGRTDDVFCLYFLPSQGTLSYSRTRAYTATVMCMDSDNNMTTAEIDVRIRTNEPPFFNDVPSFRGTCNIQAQSTTAGTIISVNPWNPSDPDGDPVFYTMTSDPETNMFEIDRSTGTIRATRDLKTLCHRSISFTIYAEDVEGNRIGPYVATCTVPDAYQPPAVSNVNKEISLSEDTPVGEDIIEPFLRTTPLTPFVTFDVETFPSSALSYIELVNSPGGHSLKLKQQLDFENAATQNFNITLRPQNGYCDPIEHYVFVRTTDANDPPRLLNKNISRTVNEGGVVVNPEWILSEQDFNDANYYSIVGGNEEGLWRIDPTNGVIYSSGTIDLDPDTREKNWSLVVQVEDLAGETDNATVTIVVEDINDNRPQFTQASFPITLMDCDSPRNLGQVFTATDADSDYRGNNLVHFTPVENEFIKIFSDGTAQIKKVPPLGESSSLSTHALDQGEVPGVLQSLTEGTVIVTTIPCTTTQPTTQPATVNNNVSVNVNSNANANANANSNTFAGLNSLITSGTNASGTGVGDIIMWALAGLLGLLLLAALTYLIWRYCAKFCTGSTSWSDGCGCNRAATPRHIRPFSQQRNISRQKEEFKSTKKEIEEEEEEEEIVQAAQQPPVVFGNTMVPVNKVQRGLRVRRLVPIKQPGAVKIKRLVPIPNNAFVNGPYGPVQNGVPPPGPPANLASYQPAPGLPTGQNTKPVQAGVTS